ncbi:MAG: response regulator [Candidatus Omnitrophica bacterium]|nr:response regulator [Candidatus Omnitrophota bacterium]
MADKKSIKVLVVDDEKVVRDFLIRLLSLENLEVKTAEDGFSALEQAKKESFDLVFLDVRMPKMDGVQTLIELRKINPQARYVMMTGYAVDDLLEKAMKEGAFASLKKPFDINQMLSILKSAQEKYPTRRLKILIVDDDKEILDFFKNLLKDKPYDITMVNTGKDALRKIEEDGFDLVFLDIILKDTTGIELCSKMRQIRKDLDIVLITGHPEKAEQIQDRVSGCLYKPFEIQKIFQEIERVRKEKGL